MKQVVGVSLAWLLLGCTHTAMHTERPSAQLHVRCNVPMAAVYVDEMLVGRAGELGRTGTQLVAGRHRVECRTDGFYSAYREVEVRPGQTAILDVSLHPVPEGEPAE